MSVDNAEKFMLKNLDISLFTSFQQQNRPLVNNRILKTSQNTDLSTTVHKHKCW